MQYRDAATVSMDSQVFLNLICNIALIQIDFRVLTFYRKRLFVFLNLLKLQWLNV